METAPSPAPSTPVSRLRARWAQARTHWYVRWGVDLGVLVLAVLLIGAFQTRGHLADVAAPPFELKTLDGQTVSLASLKGKPTLLAFWAPWCSVCKTESQNISWTRALVGDRANVLSVAASWDDLAEVQQYVDKQKVTYPVLLGDDTVRAQYKVEAFPTVYFVDAEGRVERSAVGYTTTLGLLWRLLL